MNATPSLVALAIVAWAGASSLTAAAATVVEVDSGNFWFEDATVGDGQIVIDAGDQLRVEVVDGTQHTVDIAEFGVASPKMTTGEVFVTPPLDTPGTYVLFCRTHLNRGHRTTLVVLGAATTTTTAPPTTTSAPATTTTATTTTALPATTTTAGSATTTTGGVTTTLAVSSSTVAEPDPDDEDAGTDLVTPIGAQSRIAESDGPGDVTLQASDTTIAAGMLEQAGTPRWTRSVWVGLFALIPLGGLTLAALRRLET